MTYVLHRTFVLKSYFRESIAILSPQQRIRRYLSLYLRNRGNERQSFKMLEELLRKLGCTKIPADTVVSGFWVLGLVQWAVRLGKNK